MVKFSDKLVPKTGKKKWDRENKSGTAANFGPKIGTVPLKAGQLVSMLLGGVSYVYILSVKK